MKKDHLLLILSLLVSLFIYVCYRTEKTVVNEIFISIISLEKFLQLRSAVSNTLPLNEHIIYSLPEGLWVFCITLTSKFLYLKISRFQISLFFVPLLFSIGLELFQLLHLTNGRFDFSDIWISILFWALTNYLFDQKKAKQNILDPITSGSIICILSYLIVYLAHVWK